MKYFALLALFLLTVNCSYVEEQYTYLSDEELDIIPALDDEMIERINNAGYSWKAGRNSKFEGQSLKFVKNLCGVNITEQNILMMDVPAKNVLVAEDLPENYDPRTAHPECPSIAEIGDQAMCGSCWACAAATSLSDRECLAGGSPSARRSIDDIMTCSATMSDGCSGGLPYSAFEWYVSNGACSGGWYHSAGQKPYPFAPCERASPVENGTKYPPCGGQQTAGACKSCTDQKRGSSATRIDGFGAIQQEIYTSGSVAATMNVWSDMVTYKSGVYHVHDPTAQILGGHGVRIIGWGVEDGIPYWLVANSWNDQWGDNGFFKIARGQYFCQIDQSGHVSAADV